MDTRTLRARADQLLGKHGGTIDKGIATAERFARKRTRGNPAKARTVEQAVSRVRGALAKQRRAK